MFESIKQRNRDMWWISCGVDNKSMCNLPFLPFLYCVNHSQKSVIKKKQVVYRKVPNKRTCLNKCAPSPLGWKISLKMGKNWSKMSKIGWKTPKMLPWTSSIHQGACQRAGRVYLALYGMTLLGVNVLISPMLTLMSVVIMILVVLIDLIPEITKANCWHQKQCHKEWLLSHKKTHPSIGTI